MDNVIVFKATDNMNDSVTFTDFERNLLPSPSPFDAPFTRPAISTNSIDAGVYLSGSYIPQVYQVFCPELQQHRYSVNCAERIVCTLSTCICNCVKKCTFADIWKSDDSEFHLFSPQIIFGQCLPIFTEYCIIISYGYLLCQFTDE